MPEGWRRSRWISANRPFRDGYRMRRATVQKWNRGKMPRRWMPLKRQECSLSIFVSTSTRRKSMGRFIVSSRSENSNEKRSMSMKIDSCQRTNYHTRRYKWRRSTLSLIYHRSISFSLRGGIWYNSQNDRHIRFGKSADHTGNHEHS